MLKDIVSYHLESENPLLQVVEIRELNDPIAQRSQMARTGSRLSAARQCARQSLKKHLS